MASNDYHFITHWRVKADRQTVIDLLSDAEDLPRWWPSVYLEVRELEPGDENGIGRRVSLYTKGWLPYTLRWSFVVSESNPPDGFTIRAEGDFVGRGIWTFTQDGEYTDITYDWQIAATKPLLKMLSPLLRPIFAKNHLWAMAQGETSLKLELERRAAAPGSAEGVPAPPPPTPNHPIRWLKYVLTKGTGG
ncbi:polyketide cyclase [Anaerolineae bacterium CFX9]|nr:polyketide cyclase [Anaerolineae bacterium CFX9]